MIHTCKITGCLALLGSSRVRGRPCFGCSSSLPFDCRQKKVGRGEEQSTTDGQRHNPASGCSRGRWTTAMGVPSWESLFTFHQVPWPLVTSQNMVPSYSRFWRYTARMIRDFLGSARAPGGQPANDHRQPPKVPIFRFRVILFSIFGFRNPTSTSSGSARQEGVLSNIHVQRYRAPGGAASARSGS